MYLGITRLYAVLHGTFVISCIENFEVTEDGITFYYNPYDIGCYALGGVEVHITREEMQGL